MIIKPGRRPLVRFAVLGLSLSCFAAAGAQAEKASLVERLPQPVQGALEGVAEAQRPEEEQVRGPLRLSRARLGSGTSWLPASSPMYGLLFGDADWGFMLRGNIFAGYLGFSSDRGEHHFLSTNTLLATGWYDFGRQELMARVGVSWEAFTNGNSYPLIGQTNDFSPEVPPADRQPTQELFIEASLTYSVVLTQDSALQVYLAASGEPALGPPAYNYRVSAFSDPLPPITQGRLESAPMFGVLTVGWFSQSVKLEVSWFNAGKSPTNRYDFDYRMPASFSTRLSVSPRRDWSTQLSWGYLNALGVEGGGERAQRLTGSVTYNRRFALEANWANTLAIGFRRPSWPTLPGVMLESTWNLDGQHTVFGRLEYERAAAARVGMLAVGYAYYFRMLGSLSPGIAARASMSPLAAQLEPFYGTRVPVGGMVYFQLRPGAMAIQPDTH